jgi:UPF0755 protein
MSPPRNGQRRGPPSGGGAAPPPGNKRRPRPSKPPASSRKRPPAGPASQRPRRETPPGRVAAIGAASAALFLVAVTFLARVTHSGGEGSGAEVEIELPAGVSAGDAADLLASRGVARSALMFAWYLRLFSDAEKIAPGQHLLADNLSSADLAALLIRSPARDRVQVTVPEGWTRFQIAKRLQDKRVAGAAAFLSATSDAALLAELGVPAESAEGYLFPATYRLPLDSDPREVVRQMKGEFDRRLAKVKAAHPDAPGAGARELGWGMHQVLVLASVVEREAAVDEERPMVASAFLNRFRDPTFTPKPPRLQSDATTSYGCMLSREKIPSCAAFNGRPTPEMNADQANPYSTYAHAGLPPGPICNPGERSLAATVAPADTRFLYFVAKGGGRHAFSSSLAEHNAAVKHLRELRRGP